MNVWIQTKAEVEKREMNPDNLSALRGLGYIIAEKQTILDELIEQKYQFELTNPLGPKSATKIN